MLRNCVVFVAHFILAHFEQFDDGFGQLGLREDFGQVLFQFLTTNNLEVMISCWSECLKNTKDPMPRKQGTVS